MFDLFDLDLDAFRDDDDAALDPREAAALLGLPANALGLGAECAL